jgi:D-2-hydroxyacid dehydrogenase (NADP+)
MKIKELLINLYSDVDSFSIKPRHVERLREALPGTRVILAGNRKEFLERLPEADAAIAWIFRAEWYEQAIKLKELYTPAAGRDWIALDPTGRVITHFGRFHGRIMRESLLAMMLHFNRRIGNSIESKYGKVWNRKPYDDCTPLFSQNVMIVGYGSIGQQMAELLKAFGTRIIGVKRNIAGFENDPFAEQVITFEQLREELPKADHIVLILPSGKETEHLFSLSHFAGMKPGSFLYNLGRGNCYAEEDLVAALRNGPMAGAGLDVFAEEPLPATSPLWEMPNVLVTPHASAICREYIDLYIEEWIEAVRGG